jgi:hypothetical protein
VAGSSGSSPAITWKTAATSSTVLPIGPAMSASRLSGITPARLVNPIVDRIPTRAWCDEGPRMELPVSLPSPIKPKLDATAAAVPPLDPAVTRSNAYGFFE